MRALYGWLALAGILLAETEYLVRDINKTTRNPCTVHAFVFFMTY